MKRDRSKGLARFLPAVLLVRVELDVSPTQFRPYRVAPRLGCSRVRNRLLNRLNEHFLRYGAASEAG
jgi:hypothetical protein